MNRFACSVLDLTHKCKNLELAQGNGETKFSSCLTNLNSFTKLFYYEAQDHMFLWLTHWMKVELLKENEYQARWINGYTEILYFVLCKIHTVRKLRSFFTFAAIGWIGSRSFGWRSNQKVFFSCDFHWYQAVSCDHTHQYSAGRPELLLAGQMNLVFLKRQFKIRTERHRIARARATITTRATVNFMYRLFLIRIANLMWCILKQYQLLLFCEKI